MTSRSNPDRRSRDAPRTAHPRSSRREWVPRGPSPSSPSPSTTTTTDNHVITNTDSAHTLPTMNAGRDGAFVVGVDSVVGYQKRGNFGRRGGGGGGEVSRFSSNVGQIRESFVRDLSVPQLVQEIQEKLSKGSVECMICYDMVRRTAPIWSCSSCYSIFHLNCIRKWAKAPTSVDVSAAEKNRGLNWRCPGCQSVQLTSSKEIRYNCFCEKRNDPPSDLYLTPHSCGEPCGKPLAKREGVVGFGGGNGNVNDDDEDNDDHCPHVCVLQCHPGPCPPCKAFAPPRLCPCGKKTITTRCSDRNSMLTCGRICDKVLECGRHRCQRICHKGSCDSCLVPMNASCFCKKETLAALCGEVAVKGELRDDVGIFSCDSTCGKSLTCGNHSCRELCHPGSCGECELMPWRIKTCNCGKTKLQNERHSCLDPIPTCQQICGKLLPCGKHNCKEVCHVGDCPPCMVLANQSCRCGSSNRTVECYKTVEEKEKFVCEKPCGRKKNCGRHRCSERCCPLSNSNSRVFGDWDPHLCSMVCGKKLRCGQHSCESLCHSGHCPPCLETIFVDLTCACGKTSIPPPLPCGTPHPSCQHPCLVPQPCGHNSSHGCHFGDCPPCPVPVAKECIGGHVLLRNIPCGSKDIRCNQLCGKTRKCGMHACARTCHPPPCDQPCESSSVPGRKASCGQVCGAPRSDCRHTCTAACHPSTPCPDLRCDFPVTITCGCGRLTAPVPCDAGGSHIDPIFEASVLQKLPVPLQPVEENGKKIPLGQRKLACDEECVKMERKRVLADAFDIAPPNMDSLHFGDNSAITELLADMFRREPKWVMSIEERFKFLVLGKSKGNTTNAMRVHVFCPMLKDKRDTVRQMAERWKLSVHAAGWEPKRFLAVHVTPKSKVPPRVLGSKGPVSANMASPPAFDSLVDMDPRLVVALMDLPRDADISALVLRFGGECELVWLNDKNALAVFSDPARAATALRRLDHGSAYNGAAAFLHNGGASSTSANAWVGAGATKEVGVASSVRTNPWKKAVAQETSWKEDSWGTEDWASNATDTQSSVWRGQDAPIAPSRNRWNILDHDTVSKSVSSSSVGAANTSRRAMESSSIVEPDSKAGSNSNVRGQYGGGDAIDGQSEVVDDWEEVCE